MLRCKDGRQGHHDKLDVSNGHARLLCLFLSLLQHDDVLGDAVHLRVVPVHVGAKGDHVDGMEPPAVGVKEGHDLKGQHLCIEGISILEVVVPDLVNYLAEEFGGATLSRLIVGVVFKAGRMGWLCTDAYNGYGIVSNVLVVEQQTGWAFECGTAMVGGVPQWIHEDGREGVDPPELIVENLHENGE